MESHYQDSRTCVLSRTAGIRETRRRFSLASRTLATAIDQDPDDEALLDLEVLLKQTWNVWGVSVLFDFCGDQELKLKQYAKKLREEVACILSKEDVSYTAKFDVLDLQRPKETDHPIVKVEVFAQVIGSDNKETSVYKGYLLSWRSEAFAGPAENMTRLPLLLCRGTPNTMRAVHISLSRMFDCLFVPLAASADDLMWLLPITLSPGGGQDEARKADQVLLEYTVPGQAKSDSISVKFLVRDLIDIWKRFLEEKDVIDEEDVEKFHEVLREQVQEFSGLQLGLCILHRINLPSITISESKMKITNVEAMNTVLTYLNEKALDALHINITYLNSSK